MELVEKIINLEWNEFQKVQNQGGRASCQDDKNSFQIGRKAQFLTWSQDILLSYYEDLTSSIERNQNLIAEKYARMMESTVPLEYEQIKNKLPNITKEKKNLIEDIISQRVEWMEKFLSEYPKLGGTSRTIHTSEDKFNETSFETYLRGELATYSLGTISLYYEYVKQLTWENKNLTTMEMENIIRLYGYDSLDAAENRL